MNKIYLYVGAGVVVFVCIVIAIWFLLQWRSAGSQLQLGSFGTTINNLTSAEQNNGSSMNGNTTVSSILGVSQQKIFEISSGPVVAATFIQTFSPTTTLARYIDAEDGHVYDFPLEVPGAIPRVVSDVTIPGGYDAVWVQGGNAAVMQYLEGNTIKTLYMGFPAASTTVSTSPTRLNFFPDGIISLATSPNGNSVAYLLQTSNGADGYIANVDGTGAKKLFSVPLSQVLLSWPSPNVLLVQSNSAVGVPGIVFAVRITSGSVVPLVYAPGLTAIADSTFAHIIYQTIPISGLAASYSHNVVSGLNVPLSFSPYPEKCTWSTLSTTLLYCAAPLQYEPPNYLDLWHQGTVSGADAIFAFNVASGVSDVLTAPGGTDGGAQADILQMALSPGDQYLLYVTKGDRSLWGYRLTQ